MAIKLNSTQIQNAKLIVIALNKYGVTDPNVQAGILATCYKETGFIPRSEVSYRNTSASRIRLVFGSLFSKYTDAQIDEIKKDDNKFWEVVYGHRGGNNLDGDGAKYRAKGFNGLTFKPNYLRYGNIIGVDLVKYPEKANEPEVASEICAVYFRDVINYGFKIGAFKKFGLNSLADVKTLDSGVKVAVQSNGGLGSSWDGNIMKEGYNKASAVVGDLFSSYIGKVEQLLVDSKKKISEHPIIVASMTLVVVIASYLLYSTLIKK